MHFSKSDLTNQRQLPPSTLDRPWGCRDLMEVIPQKYAVHQPDINRLAHLHHCSLWDVPGRIRGREGGKRRRGNQTVSD